MSAETDRIREIERIAGNRHHSPRDMEALELHYTGLLELLRRAEREEQQAAPVAVKPAAVPLAELTQELHHGTPDRLLEFIR